MPELVELVSIALQIDVDAPRPGSTPGQYYAAVVLIGILAALVVAYRYRTRYAGLESSERSHKAALVGSRRDQTPRTIRIPKRSDPVDFRDDVRALFFPGALIEQDQVSGLEALSSVVGSFRESFRPVTSRLSAFVLRLVSISWLVVVFGALAVSTDAVVRLILVDTRIDDTAAAIERAIELTVDVVDAGREILLSFPYIGDLWSIAFALGTLGLEWIYHRYYLVAIALLLLAVIVAHYERYISDELETKLYQERRGLAVAWIGSIGLVWIAGAGPAGIGSYLYRAELGAQIGFVLASITALVLAAIGIRNYWQRIQSTSHLAREETAIVRAYLVARRAGISAALLGLILVVMYAIVLAATDKLAAIGEALLAADVGVKAVIVGLVALIVFGTAYLVRSSWTDVRSAISESLSRTKLRTVLFWRGSLAIGFAAGYLFAFALTRDIALAIVTATFGAIVAVALYELLERAKYRVSLFESSPTPPRAVTVQGYRLQDADGGRHPFAVINGSRELARDDVDELVDEILDVAGAIQAGERPAPSIGSYHAETLTELGQIGEDRTRDRVDEHARKLLVEQLRPVGQPVDVEDVEDGCEDVPEPAWRSWLDELRDDVVLDHGEQLELIRDPWGGS